MTIPSYDRGTKLYYDMMNGLDLERVAAELVDMEGACFSRTKGQRRPNKKEAGQIPGFDRRLKKCERGSDRGRSRI